MSIERAQYFHMSGGIDTSTTESGVGCKTARKNVAPASTWHSRCTYPGSRNTLPPVCDEVGNRHSDQEPSDTTSPPSPRNVPSPPPFSSSGSDDAASSNQGSPIHHHRRHHLATEPAPTLPKVPSSKSTTTAGTSAASAFPKKPFAVGLSGCAKRNESLLEKPVESTAKSLGLSPRIIEKVLPLCSTQALVERKQATESAARTPASDSASGRYRGRGPVGVSKLMTREKLEALFGQPMEVAATSLGVSTTIIKRLCRKHGVMKWPYRQLCSLDRDIERAERQLRKATARSEEWEVIKARIDRLVDKKESIIRGGRAERTEAQCSPHSSHTSSPACAVAVKAPPSASKKRALPDFEFARNCADAESGEDVENRRTKKKKANKKNAPKWPKKGGVFDQALEDDQRSRCAATTASVSAHMRRHGNNSRSGDSDIAGSGSLEADAACMWNFVMRLYSPKNYKILKRRPNEASGGRREMDSDPVSEEAREIRRKRLGRAGAHELAREFVEHSASATPNHT